MEISTDIEIELNNFAVNLLHKTKTWFTHLVSITSGEDLCGR